jgi:hypothetical protein
LNILRGNRSASSGAPLWSSTPRPAIPAHCDASAPRRSLGEGGPSRSRRTRSYSSDFASCRTLPRDGVGFVSGRESSIGWPTSRVARVPERAIGGSGRISSTSDASVPCRILRPGTAAWSLDRPGAWRFQTDRCSSAPLVDAPVVDTTSTRFTDFERRDPAEGSMRMATAELSLAVDGLRPQVKAALDERGK